MRWNVATSLLMRTIIGCSIFSLLLLGQKGMAKSGAWSGIIINRGCTADEAFAESPKCTEDRGPGAKLMLYDDTTRQIFALEPQTQAAGHLGDSVTVEGALDGNAIRVMSVKLLTGIGLSVGQRAPDFSLSDQFGHPQSLATLQGKHGTVLLFFRSADW
jgi:hypothetical protein